METATVRKQTAFRLRADLLQKLKTAAQKENRSLNNYVESVLMDVVEYYPNDTTLAAMREANPKSDLKTLDANNFDEFIDSL